MKRVRTSGALAGKLGRSSPSDPAAVAQAVLLCSEKVHGVHQLPPAAGDEERQVCAGLQAVAEDDPPGESQAGDPGQQLPGSQACPHSPLSHSPVSLEFICRSLSS